MRNACLLFLWLGELLPLLSVVSLSVPGHRSSVIPGGSHNHNNNNRIQRHSSGQPQQKSLSTQLCAASAFSAAPLDDDDNTSHNKPSESIGDVVRWGIIGAGSIAEDFAKAVEYTPGAQVGRSFAVLCLLLLVVSFIYLVSYISYFGIVLARCLWMFTKAHLSIPSIPSVRKLIHIP